MATQHPHTVPPRPDRSLPRAKTLMRDAHAAARGMDAESRAQLKDSIVSIRWFLAEAEKEMLTPE